MKHGLIVVTIILILGGAWYFQAHPKAEAPEAADTTTEQVAPTLEVEAVVEDETNKDDMEDTTSAEAGDTKTFTVSGTNFAFDVTEMRVKEGDTVTINFESADGFHDWVVDAFEAATDKVRPGTPTSVTFVADKAGTYEYYCSVGSHRANGMVGTLIVE